MNILKGKKMKFYVVLFILTSAFQNLHFQQAHGPTGEGLVSMAIGYVKIDDRQTY